MLYLTLKHTTAKHAQGLGFELQKKKTTTKKENSKSEKTCNENRTDLKHKKTKNINRKNLESTELDPNTCGNSVFNKDGISTHCKRWTFHLSSHGGAGGEWKLDLYLITFTKINS